MTVGELIQVLRRELNDTASIEFSDAELINYINRAQQFIVDELVGVRSPYMLKEANLTFTSDQEGNQFAQLPSDFYTDYAFWVGSVRFYAVPSDADLRFFQNGYKILGSRIYANTGRGRLVYFYLLPLYSNSNNQVLLHSQLIPLLITFATLLAKNRISVSTALEPVLLREMKTAIKNFANIHTEFPALSPAQFRAIRWK